MGTELTVRLHAIAEDGLPKMDQLTGRVGFIFDGCIVSGWPLTPETMGAEGIDFSTEIREHANRGEWLWEGNSDVARSTMFANVTHWVEFPAPLWEMTA